MKKMKRLFAVLLTLAMVLGMSVVTFAEPKKPTETDSATVTISGITEEVTYKAYQIIDAKYDANGFIGYVWAPGINESDSIKAGEKVEFTKGTDDEDVVTGLTDALVTELAANPAALTNKKDPFTTATPLEAGTWMILVTPTAEKPDTVYNPMIVSVYYSVTGSGDSNELVPGSVDASKNWTLTTTNAFAKSSTITFTKDLDDAANNTKVAVGDEVPFTLTSVIPSYDSTYYENPTFKIKDTIVNGLKYTGEPRVYLGGTAADNLLTKDIDYTLTYDADAEFEINFKFEADKIKNLAGATVAGRTVTVKYSAIVLESAITKVGENKATLTYSKTPLETTTKEDKEYVFSFALHNEFSKKDEADKNLEDAVFTLYVEDAESKDSIAWGTDHNIAVTEVVRYTTKDDGDIRFKGLDGDKVYYVKETEAPDGYSINDTVYKVVFSFRKPENYNGGDTEYTVTITNNKTDEEKTYTVAYGELVNGDYGNSPKAGSDEATIVLNTKLSSLPSTGGIGTTIFTIAGCLIMIAAAGLFFASRRKSAK